MSKAATTTHHEYSFDGWRRADEQAEDGCKWFDRACLAVIWIVAALNGLLRYLGVL